MVICALKAHQSFRMRRGVCAAFNPDTAVVTAMNGIPWWYSTKTAAVSRTAPGDGRSGGAMSSIGPQRAIGCVVEPACEVIAGSHRAPRFNRFIIGEPDGSRSVE